MAITAFTKFPFSKIFTTFSLWGSCCCSLSLFSSMHFFQPDGEAAALRNEIRCYGFGPPNLQHKYEITFAYTDAAQIFHPMPPTAAFSSGLLHLNFTCFTTFCFPLNSINVHISNYRLVIELFGVFFYFIKAKLAWLSAVQGL